MFQLPKGRSFSKRVYATGALLAILLFLLATYFFVHNADKGIKQASQTWRLILSMPEKPLKESSNKNQLAAW